MDRIQFRTDDTIALTVLDAHHEHDLLFITSAMNNPEVTKFLMARFPYSIENEREWLKNLYKDKTNLVFGIVEKKDDILIGTMGLHNIQWIHGTASTGAWIKEDVYRGKGYGTRAKMILLRYAFYELGLRKIGSSVLASNLRSKAYNEKCGYVVEGVLKEQVYCNGTYVDEFMMAVTRERFDAAWKRHYDSLPSA